MALHLPQVQLALEVRMLQICNIVISNFLWLLSLQRFFAQEQTLLVSLVVLLSQGLVIKLSTVEELFVTHVTNVCTHTNDQPYGTVDNAW